MKRDVHAAALRATSKLVFSAAFLAGCSGGGEAGESLPTQEAQLKQEAEAGTCDGRFSCEDLVKAAFPVPQHYPGQEVTTTDAVKQCCTDLLISSHGMIEQRWDCCKNHAAPPEGSEETLWIACTPWGPPVPPAMRDARVPREPIGVA